MRAKTNNVQDEPFSETKKRLEKRTGFKGKMFEKIKFAIVRRSHYSKPQYLTDGMCNAPSGFVWENADKVLPQMTSYGRPCRQMTTCSGLTTRTGRAFPGTGPTCSPSRVLFFGPSLLPGM